MPLTFHLTVLIDQDVGHGVIVIGSDDAHPGVYVYRR